MYLADDFTVDDAIEVLGYRGSIWSRLFFFNVLQLTDIEDKLVVFTKDFCFRSFPKNKQIYFGMFCRLFGRLYKLKYGFGLEMPFYGSMLH